MTKLFIANCTKQIHDFLYLVPETKRLMMTRIGIGEQAAIYQDTQIEVLEGIVAQHQRYGLVPVNEINRTRAFIGLCYQFDKPIDMEKVVLAINHNDEVLIERGATYRKEAAVSFNNMIERDIADGAPGRLKEVEVEVIEDTKGVQDQDLMKESILVTREGDEPSAPPSYRASSGKNRRRR